MTILVLFSERAVLMFVGDFLVVLGKAILNFSNHESNKSTYREIYKKYNKNKKNGTGNCSIHTYINFVVSGE